MVSPHDLVLDRSHVVDAHRGPLDIEGAHTSVACLDPGLTIQQVNQEFDRRFGSPVADLCGRPFCDLVHPSVQQPLMQQFARLLEGKRHRFTTEVITVGQDTAHTLPLTAVAVRGSHIPDVAAILVMLPPADGESADSGVVMPRKKLLSEVDARILEGIAAGVSTVPLASRLYLSRQGVEYHVSGLLRKLKVPNRAALVSRAYSMGVLKVGTWPPKVVEDYIK
ncbi:PAS domain-containing protein [Streptomyces capillispiralis]|uniref:Regulatory LuxR family protein n=1 Tax=Streptomyces capillispiralis TaxID=68182 RepID=A0A561T801_9ACTN|nr:regulatory LuxR family protein [Streptomyces capillispiralis]